MDVAPGVPLFPGVAVADFVAVTIDEPFGVSGVIRVSNLWTPPGTGREDHLRLRSARAAVGLWFMGRPAP